MRILVAVLISAYLPLASGSVNCRISDNLNLATLKMDSKTRYCEPSKGCTFVEEYGDCIRDNETPLCIYYSYISQVCNLCYVDNEPGIGNNDEWKRAPKPANFAQRDSQKVPAGARVCDKVPP